MKKIQERREKVGMQREAEADRARSQILTADLMDAADIVGGVGNQDAGVRARAEAEKRDAALRGEFGELEKQMAELEDVEAQGELAAVDLMGQEEQVQKEQEALLSQKELEKQKNDPDSDLTRQAVQTAEIVLGQGVLPDGITAAQLEKVYPDIVKQVETRRQQAQQLALEERKIMLDRAKEDRRFQKQLQLQERREMPVLTQNLARRGQDVASSYLGAKDAIDMVKTGALAQNPSKATDETLLQGYERLLKNQATTYDEEGNPVINKTLMDQANSKIRGWVEVMKGNKGVLPERDRRSLLNEAQNLYRIEQGFNVKRLADMKKWTDRISEKNPNVDFTFVAPGIDEDVLSKEVKEFFPEGGRESYATMDELAGGGSSSPASGGEAPSKKRQKFVPGGGSGGERTSSGRRIFRPGG
jgi:predicted metal-dependent TIM-barrel fold hydrolase